MILKLAIETCQIEKHQISCVEETSQEISEAYFK